MPKSAVVPIPQHIKHSYTNISGLFTEIEKLYYRVSREDTSNRRLFDVSTLDVSLKPMCELLRKYIYFLGNFDYDSKQYPVLDLPKYDDKNMILCCSGGKDSVAAALLYKKLGYNVYLYHMHGINVTYYDEFRAIENIAKALDVPYYIEDVAMSGTQCHIEHPMKNMLIANGAIHYGIREGIGTNIAFGNFTESLLAYNEFEVCAGDCIEMWEVYNQAIQTIIPGFKVNMILPRNEETFYQFQEHPELLELVNSCITPYRFKPQHIRDNNAKYGIKLLPYRCGSCWKCCMEYIYFTDHNIFEYNKEFYRHCLSSLSYATYKETGEWAKNMDELWNRYFFYDMRQSKEKEIYYAAIRHKYIKWPKTTEQSVKG